MALYTKQSLQKLKSVIDMVDVASGFMDLKRQGSVYKGLCPFHEEKTPSFIIQASDDHYHCFGCQEHGDAISFVMKMMQLNFVDAIEYLAQKYSIHLEKEQGASEGPSNRVLKEAIAKSAQFYQYMLLRTAEGKEALSYLLKRGIDLEYIKRFGIGLAPQKSNLLPQVLAKQKIDLSIARKAGAINAKNLDYFHARITFPIHDRVGSVIGFSARAFQKKYSGGKYINTPATPLFKKSNVLFGLPFSKKRMAKEKKALLVEGQLDALTLIHHGFDYTVATLGTALTDLHAKQLNSLGVEEVTLIFDGDDAGLKAAFKAGNILQQSGLIVSICRLDQGEDPHQMIVQKGIEFVQNKLDQKIDYLRFMIESLSQGKDTNDPGFKANLATKIKTQVLAWEDPILVHESLKRIATLLDIPQHLMSLPKIEIKVPTNQKEVVGKRALEMDVLYYLLFGDDEKKTHLQIAIEHLTKEHFSCIDCKSLYSVLIEKQQNEDLLQLCIDASEKAMDLVQELSKKKRQKTSIDPYLKTVERLMQRKWLEEREKIKEKLQSGKLKDSDAIDLAKRFDQMKNNPPILA